MLPGVSFSDPSAQNASIGNSTLKPYLSENLDFGFDIFTGQEGYVGIQAFRKRLTGFTIAGVTRQPFSYLAQYGITYDTLNPTQKIAYDNATDHSVNVTQQVNSTGPVTINGVEFNFVQPLDFIGLRGFGVSGNYTIVDQFGTGAAPSFASNVPPHSFNMTAYYEKSGVSVRISQVYQAGSTNSRNGNGVIDLTQPTSSPNAFIYNNSYRQWDFASSFDLAKIFHLSSAPEVTFDIQNIFKAKQRSYFEFPNAANGMINAGSFYMLGLRQKF
jgi:TonB-dependent receptor